MFDVVIIGAGPAGLSAGLFAGLYGLRAVVIGEQIGGEVKLAPMIHDYPGIGTIKGADWLEAMLGQVREAGVDVIEEKIVLLQKKENPPFMVGSQDRQYESTAVILATGNQRRRPNYSGPQLARSAGVNLTQEGLIDVDESLATNIPGVFAAGNCLEHPIGQEQLVDAAAQGTRAAAQAYEYLKGQKAPILWGKAKIPNL